MFSLSNGLTGGPTCHMFSRNICKGCSSALKTKKQLQNVIVSLCLSASEPQKDSIFPRLQKNRQKGEMTNTNTVLNSLEIWPVCKKTTNSNPCPYTKQGRKPALHISHSSAFSLSSKRNILFSASNDTGSQIYAWGRSNSYARLSSTVIQREILHKENLHFFFFF